MAKYEAITLAKNGQKNLLSQFVGLYEILQVFDLFLLACFNQTFCTFLSDDG